MNRSLYLARWKGEGKGWGVLAELSPCLTVEGGEKFIFWIFFVALGEKLLLIITKQGKYFFFNFVFV